MFESVLIANRGEIARRVIRTCRRLGIRTIAVYSEADRSARHVAEADEAIEIGSSAPGESYLRGDAVLEAARASGAAAIHPGYGFLSESAEFARSVEAAGIVWIGPEPDQITEMGDKIAARNRMEAAGVPVAPGTRESVVDLPDAVEQAKIIGYPIMVKAAAGGGGIGMSVVHDEDELVTAFETARSRAERFFGSPSILLERYIASARHIEVQVLGLADGRVVALGERDCSVQRRHQKVVEESPSPFVGPELRERMLAAAVRAADAISYRGAGTVEFLVDTSTGEFIFLEMNTRLQVEHPVTEMVTGIDLVEQQLRVAAGLGPTFDVTVPTVGHAIEFRVYAEDPVRFLPSPGEITVWSEPEGPGVRVDSGYVAGDTVTAFYDPMIAKLIAWGVDRDQALERLRTAAEQFTIVGPKVNLPLLHELLAEPSFLGGEYDTSIIAGMRAGSRA